MSCGYRGIKKNNRNQLTKQLNNIQKSLNSIANTLIIPPAIIDKTKIVITAAKAAVNIVSFIPSTVATPIPVGPILIAKDAIKFLEGLISKMDAKINPGAY